MSDQAPEAQEQLLPPHLLIFPLPAQGHINSMLNLAELLSLARLHVTFLLTDYIYHRLIRNSTIESRFSNYPGFRFQTISDGLPEDATRPSDSLIELVGSLQSTTKPLLVELLLSDRLCADDRKQVTCIVGDGTLDIFPDVGEIVGIPVFIFRTVSACCFWTYFCVPQLIDAGEVPFKGNDLDVAIANVTGIEGFLRRRDLPNCFRAGDLSDPHLQLLVDATRTSTRSRGLIFNTFEDLEGPILSQIRPHCKNLYAIGPLHAHLRTRLGAKTTLKLGSSNGLWKEDKSCLKWLDSQPLKSVIYVSFGSGAMVTRDQLMEFWYGLLNSGQKFLWVQRPDSIAGGDGQTEISAELLEGTKERGYIVEWAPQQEVLDHEAICGFLTHSGWNSTLESIVAGVPMICWPCFADQQVNSRFVEKEWKVGLDMKDICDRVIVEKMVRDLMEVRKDEFVRSGHQMAQLASRAVSQGGSSYCDFDSLIEEIRLIDMQSST